MEFSRQEYWSELPFPLPGDLPDPGMEPESPASPVWSGRFFTASATWEAPRVQFSSLQSLSHVQLFVTPMESTRLLCPWDSPGKKTGVDCHFLLQGMFPTQGLNLHLLCLSALPGGFFITVPLGKPHRRYIIDANFHLIWASLVAQMVKNLASMQETWV